jgi:hypothetical protein
MTDPLRLRLSRRRLMTTAAAISAGLALGGTSAVNARQGRAVEVLTHDEVQEAVAFGRGRHSGTTAQNGKLEGSGIFESEVIESPFPFTHVGLHWRGNAGSSFELRTSADGAAWSDWQALHIEASPDETPAGETYASLSSAPRHHYVQYRSSLSHGSIEKVTSTLLNAQDGPVLDVAEASLDKPSVIDFARADWGCNEALRFDRRGREIWPRMYVPVKKLVIHHTAGRNDYTPEEAAGEVRAVYTYHAQNLGWGDIGYNVVIDRFGRSYEGRYSRDLSGGREVFGADVVAGHALAHNYGSCGFALLGEFEPGYDVANDDEPDLEPPEAMIGKLVDLLAYRAAERFIDPAATSHFLLSDGSWNDILPNVCGHRDCLQTACPGQLVYNMLGSIRSQVASRLGWQSGPAFTSGPDGGPGVPNQTTGQLAYSWSGPAGAEYKFFLEGWSKTSTSEAVTYLTGFTTDRRPAWPGSWTTNTEVSYSDLASGHYTMHLQRRDGTRTSYEASRTVLIKAQSSGGNRPPKGPNR